MTFTEWWNKNKGMPCLNEVYERQQAEKILMWNRTIFNLKRKHKNVF